jgi:hypothetical protein
MPSFSSRSTTTSIVHRRLRQLDISRPFPLLPRDAACVEPQWRREVRNERNLVEFPQLDDVPAEAIPADVGTVPAEVAPEKAVATADKITNIAQLSIVSVATATNGSTIWPWLKFPISRPL